MKPISMTLTILRLGLVSTFALALSVQAGFAGDAPAEESELSLSACESVGLSGTTYENDSFCTQFGGEIAARAKHSDTGNRVEASILAFLDARSAGDISLRGYIEVEAIADEDVDIDARINQAFVEVGHFTAGYAPSILQLNDPLNFLGLDVAPSLPKTSDLAERHEPDFQARAFANIGFVTATVGVENLDGVIDGDDPTLVARLEASEIWGDVSLTAKHAPIGADSGQLIALDATVPVPVSVGTKLRLVSLYTNGLVSYLDQPVDIAEAEGWSTHLSVSHELDDTWAIAVGAGAADTEGTDGRYTLGGSLTASPDFDTKISFGANYDWPDESLTIGAGFAHEPTDSLTIDGKAEYEVETSDFEAALSIIQSY